MSATPTKATIAFEFTSDCIYVYKEDFDKVKTFLWDDFGREIIKFHRASDYFREKA